MFFSNLKPLLNIVDSFNNLLHGTNTNETTIKEKEDVMEEILNDTEIDRIKLLIIENMDNYIEDNILYFSSIHFHDDLKLMIMNDIYILLKNIYNYESLYNDISSIYDDISHYYFNNTYPYRSYPHTFIRINPIQNTITPKINYIKNKPQPTQRTNEWYLFRYNLITASSAWKAFKSQSTINQLIVEKCTPIHVEKYNSVNTNSALHHGNKYEEVSVMYYEHKYNTKVADFGCIQHDTHSFLGASPDGINVDPQSNIYGRMLEIKNPISREITGIPKEEYWIQMQLQMEACNLNECDFLETSFKEYEDEEEFIKDGDFTYTIEGQLKGIIIYFMKDNKPLYEYMPVYYTSEQYDKWLDDIMDKHNNITWIKNIYWRLENCSCVLVLRNKQWFKSAIIQIEQVWNIIEKERISGFDHRLPKKNTRTIRSNSLSEKTSEPINKLNAKDEPNVKDKSNVKDEPNAKDEPNTKDKPNAKDDNESTNTQPNCLINVSDLKKQIIFIDTTT